MYLSQLAIKNFRQFGGDAADFKVEFHKGVTALVGENDAGKTAVIDAIRYALTTRDQEYLRLQPEDFHIAADGRQANEITLRVRISGLDESEKGAFAEYLTFESSRDRGYREVGGDSAIDGTVD